MVTNIDVTWRIELLRMSYTTFYQSKRKMSNSQLQYSSSPRLNHKRPKHWLQTTSDMATVVDLSSSPRFNYKRPKHWIHSTSDMAKVADLSSRPRFNHNRPKHWLHSTSDIATVVDLCLSSLVRRYFLLPQPNNLRNTELNSRLKNVFLPLEQYKSKPLRFILNAYFLKNSHFSGFRIY